MVGERGEGGWGEGGRVVEERGEGGWGEGGGSNWFYGLSITLVTRGTRQARIIRHAGAQIIR